MLFIDASTEYFREKWNMGEIGPHEHHRELYEFMCTKQCANTVIVGESFQYRPNQQHAELMSNEYIGVIKYFEQNRKAPVVWQTKSYGRGFFDDKKLKKLRKHMQTKEGHANDAMGHLLQYMTFGPLARKDILEALK